jgi:hypothetical protein
VSVTDEQDFVRHVGGSHIHSNVINGSAFERAVKDTDGLSICIRGIFSKEAEADVAAIRIAVGARRKLGSKSVFAEVNVGVALRVLHEFDDSITIDHAPLPAQEDIPADPSHALIVGLPFKGESTGSLRSELAGDLLARRIVRIYPAVV